MGFLRQSFLEVHTLTTTYQKAFILRPYVPCRVCYESMTLDPRVNAWGRARVHIVVKLQNMAFLFQSFLEVHILTTTYQKAFILRPNVPCKCLLHSLTSDPRVHGQGWDSMSESSTSLKCGTSVFSRSNNFKIT